MNIFICFWSLMKNFSCTNRQEEVMYLKVFWDLFNETVNSYNKKYHFKVISRNITSKTLHYCNMKKLSFSMPFAFSCKKITKISWQVKWEFIFFLQKQNKLTLIIQVASFHYKQLGVFFVLFEQNILLPFWF